MYPSRELRGLAARRAYLLERIEARREDCLVAGCGVADGVERLQVWGHLLKAGGLVGLIGAGLVAWRRRRTEADEGNGEDEEGGTSDGSSWGGTVVRWAPVALRAFRIVSSFL